MAQGWCISNQQRVTDQRLSWRMRRWMAWAGCSAGRYLSNPCSVFMTQSLITYTLLSFNLCLPPSSLCQPPSGPLLVQLWNEMTRFFLCGRAVPASPLKGWCCCLPWCVYVCMCVDNLLIKSGRLITLSSVWTKEKHPACSSISCWILGKRWFLFRWVIRCADWNRFTSRYLEMREDLVYLLSEFLKRELDFCSELRP